MAVAWPKVKDRLVALIPTLTPAPAMTFDGPVPTGEAPASYVCVGWQPSTDEDAVGSYEHSTAMSGFAAAEAGEVLLEIAAVSGNAAVPDAFSIADAVTTWVQANQTLGGVLSANGTAQTLVSVVEAQSAAGSAQRLLVTLTYTTFV